MSSVAMEQRCSLCEWNEMLVWRLDIWPLPLCPAQEWGPTVWHHIPGGGKSNVFTMHALEIKSYSSEGQEGREFKKKKNPTGWQFGQAVGVHFANLWRAGSLLSCGLMTEPEFFVILNEFLLLSAPNFNMRQRDRNVLPGKLLIYKNALKYFYRDE